MPCLVLIDPVADPDRFPRFPETCKIFKGKKTLFPSCFEETSICGKIHRLLCTGSSITVFYPILYFFHMCLLYSGSSIYNHRCSTIYGMICSTVYGMKKEKKLVVVMTIFCNLLYSPREKKLVVSMVINCMILYF